MFFQKVNTLLLWKGDDELLWVLVELLVATPSNIETAKWCHRAAPTHQGVENYCEIPGHHLQPTQDANFADCETGKERKVSQGVAAFATSPGENNVSGMAAAASRFVGSKFVLESPSTVWPLPLLQ